MDPIGLQRQIRNNSSDLLSFCAELNQWGKEMKRKDESLKTGEEDTGVSKPKIKARKTSDPSKPKVEDKPKTVKKKKRVVGSDYSAWDRFDVEAECAKLDEEKPEGYESDELTDEYDETSRDEAIYEKEKGNKFVKLQKWDDAIECYTKAIQCYGYDPIFYANRALCYLKKLNYRAAETDCTNALRLDKTYVKAYQRRAAAREALNQLTEAHSDLLKVFDYEPNNTESKATLGKLEKKLENFNQKASVTKKDTIRPKSKFTMTRKPCKLASIQDEAVASTSQQSTAFKASQTPKLAPYWPSGNEVELIEAVYKPPHLRSKKPLKRVEILDSDGVKFDIREVQTIKTNTTEKEIPQGAAWPNPKGNSNVIKCDDLKIVERKMEDYKKDEKQEKVKTKKGSKFSKEATNKQIISHTKVTNELNSTEVTTNIDTNKTINEKPIDTNEFNYSVPETSVDFSYNWRLLNNKSEWKYLYLKQVNPKKFATIFKQSLDCDIFSGIIQTLAENFIDKNVPVYEYLLGLCKVKRFSMLAMFMSDDDKKNMFKLLDFMRADNSLTKADVDNLMETYGI